MSEIQNQSQFAAVFESFKRGEISRRQFIAQGMALGVGMTVLGFLIRGVQTTSAAYVPHPQDAVTAPPAAGTEGKTRGQDGELRILQWQAATEFGPHTATGTKDFLASDLILEPLIRYLPDGSLFPNLVTEVPTIENGGLSEDLTSVTFNLVEGVVWSDGTPFTANDVVFTWEFVLNEENNTATIDVWRPISAVTAVDDLTVQVTYENPNLNWYVPFSGIIYGAIYPRHYIEANGGDIMKSAPIGTGPYVITDFAPGDQVIYNINESYRFADKPYFATVNLKGGGEASTAAQSVLQTGDWDYAWNMQVSPDVIAGYLEGGQGQFKVIPGTSVERINVNFSDPRVEGPEGQLSYYENPHPILSDVAVRQAIALAVDRELIATQFYAGPPGESAGRNQVTGIPAVESPNTTNEQNVEMAAQVLEDAGWVMEGDVRVKDGVELYLNFFTSINQVRQNTQAVVSQNLEAIGFSIDLGQTDSGIYFDGSAGNIQNINHMYMDMNMYTNGASNPTPIEYFTGWYSGGAPDYPNVAQQSNAWLGQNFQRWINEEFDTLYERLQSGQVTDIEEVYQGIIQLNDLIITNYVTIPLVSRAADKYCVHNTLLHGDDPATAEDNVAVSSFELNYWNIANWNRSSQPER